MNFVAIDVETANEDYSSICAIGLVSFSENAEKEAIYYLIDPEDDFSPVNMAIHGITPEDVSGKPTLREALPLLTHLSADTTLVHHTAFDRVALTRAAAKYGVDLPEFRWLDTARVARRTWPEVANRGYGLAELAERLDIVFQHHHAREDARVCGMILIRSLADNGISLEECHKLATSKHLPGYESVKAAEGNPDGALFGETVVFTGALTMPRRVAAEIAAKAGCSVRNSVTHQTSILVVGDQDIRKLNGADKSDKHRKAEAMIAAGASLRILTETDFEAICALDAQ